MTEHTGVLVVGGSVAGLRTAEALRRHSYPGAVTILEAGKHPPYDRTALSKKVLGPGGHTASVSLRSPEDLGQLGIDLRLRSRAESVDTGRRTVRLAGGGEIGYSALVIATGAGARVLPAAPPSVHYLRTLGDAYRLREAMTRVRNAVVVGAGFIGSEVAVALSGQGCAVTVVEPAGYPLGRVLGEVVGARLAGLHEARGVRLVPGRAVTAVHEDGTGPDRYRVLLDDGAVLRTELVVVGIGARPNVAWLDGSGVEVTDGVLCDEFCRASAPAVHAVGDVARWPNSLFGESMRVEHWTNAMEQAAVVAWNIVNPDRPRSYTPVPYVWSDQYGLRLQIVGRPRPDDEVRIVEDDPSRPVLVALYARQGRLAGAFTLNAPSRVLALRRALMAAVSLDEALEIGSGNGSSQRHAAYKML
jgi:NADPH-dependent 2,4-dienoyl-CoA reductase/sulfur reductase-like enzyme